MITNRKILIFLSAGLLGLLAAITYVIIGMDSNFTPKQVTLTNVTNNGATVVWYTEEAVEGRIFVREIKSDAKNEGNAEWPILSLIALSGNAFYDDRNMEQNQDGKWTLMEEGERKRYTHHVSLRGLEPEKDYEIRVGGKLRTISRDSSDTLLPKIKTRTTVENLETPDPAYGKIAGENLSTDNIIMLSLAEKTAQGTPDGNGITRYGNLLSATLSDTNTYSIDVHGFKYDFADYAENKKDFSLLLQVVAADGSTGIKTFEFKDYKPLGTVLLGNNADESKSNTLNQSLVPLISAAPSACGDGEFLTDEGACVDKEACEDFCKEKESDYSAANGVCSCPDAPAEEDGPEIIEGLEDEIDESCPNGKLKAGNIMIEPSRCDDWCGSGGLPATVYHCSCVCPSIVDVDYPDDLEAIFEGDQNAVEKAITEQNERKPAQEQPAPTIPGDQDAQISPEAAALLDQPASGNMTKKNCDQLGQPDYHTAWRLHITKIKNKDIAEDICGGTHPYFLGWGKYAACCSSVNPNILAVPVTPPEEQSNTQTNLPNIKIILGTVSAQFTNNNTNDSLTVNNNGHYAFFEDGEKIASRTIIVRPGQSEVTVKLYYDDNSNGKRDENEELFDDYTQITLSQEADAEEYLIYPGWNLITFPLYDTSALDPVQTAEQLLDYWNGDGAEITHIAKFKTGQFQMFTKREGDNQFSNDFDLIPGEAYFILNHAETQTLTFKGNRIESAVKIPLANGWNMVGIISPDMTYTAESLTRKINEEDIAADTVSKYDAGQYKSVVFEDDILYGNDYNIIDTQGYFIRIKEGGDKDFTP